MFTMRMASTKQLKTVYSVKQVLLPIEKLEATKSSPKFEKVASITVDHGKYDPTRAGRYTDSHREIH